MSRWQLGVSRERTVLPSWNPRGLGFYRQCGANTNIFAPASVPPLPVGQFGVSETGAVFTISGAGPCSFSWPPTFPSHPGIGTIGIALVELTSDSTPKRIG